MVYLEVGLPATQTLRIVRSDRKRDIPQLRKLEVAAKKASGCDYELVASKSAPIYLVPARTASVALKSVVSPEAIFEPESLTTTPDYPGGGGGG